MKNVKSIRSIKKEDTIMKLRNPLSKFERLYAEAFLSGAFNLEHACFGNQPMSPYEISCLIDIGIATNLNLLGPDYLPGTEDDAPDYLEALEEVGEQAIEMLDEGMEWEYFSPGQEAVEMRMTYREAIAYAIGINCWLNYLEDEEVEFDTAEAILFAHERQLSFIKELREERNQFLEKLAACI